MSWCRLRGRSTTTDGYIDWCFWKTARATKLHRIQRTNCCWMQKRFKPFQKREAHQLLNLRQCLDLEMFKGTRGGLCLRQALDMWHPPLQTLSVLFMIASARTTGDPYFIYILCCRHSLGKMISISCTLLAGYSLSSWLFYRMHVKALVHKLFQLKVLFLHFCWDAGALEIPHGGCRVSTPH